MLRTTLLENRNAIKNLLALGVFSFSLGFAAKPTATPDLDVWLSSQSSISETKMFANFSPAGAKVGTILASPSKNDPNYYYFWVRDGALVMQSVLDLANQGSTKARDAMETYVRFSRDNQIQASWNLGEPRFNIDGTVNTEPWGRPQNDGPALRALLLTRFANQLLAEGKSDYVIRELYAPALPAETVIKADLEFTAHHWNEKCVDLWEEVWGYHFFTRAVQYMALKEGASLADRLGDGGAASFYREQADLLEKELARHWSEEKDYYLSTLEFSASSDHQKPSQLDVSVLLAALAAEQESGILSLADDRMLKTAMAVEASFKNLYGLNRDQSTGTAIGRYPEDTYYGGNPWVLSTAAYAEMDLRLADQIARSKSFVLTATQASYFSDAGIESQRSVGTLVAGTDLGADRTLKAQVVAALQAKADRYLERIRRHANQDGSLSEQFGRDNGKMLSARDLSWSYASFLRALSARTRANASASAL